MAMEDVAAFVLARLDEDEQAARAAVKASGGAVWRADDSGIFPEDNQSMHPGAFLADAYGFTDPGYGDHIARHDPARVLREVEGKRALYIWCRRMNPPHGLGGALAGEARRVLSMVAFAWANHPDYREEW